MMVGVGAPFRAEALLAGWSSGEGQLVRPTGEQASWAQSKDVIGTVRGGRRSKTYAYSPSTTLDSSRTGRVFWSCTVNCDMPAARRSSTLTNGVVATVDAYGKQLQSHPCPAGHAAGDGDQRPVLRPRRGVSTTCCFLQSAANTVSGTTTVPASRSAHREETMGERVGGRRRGRRWVAVGKPTARS